MMIHRHTSAKITSKENISTIQASILITNFYERYLQLLLQDSSDRVKLKIKDQCRSNIKSLSIFGNFIIIIIPQTHLLET